MLDGKLLNLKMGMGYLVKLMLLLPSRLALEIYSFLRVLKSVF
jgi:hypothetical protein